MAALLEAKAFPDARRKCDEYTPMYLALRDGRSELVSLLVAHKADVNASLYLSHSLAGITSEVQDRDVGCTLAASSQSPEKIRVHESMLEAKGVRLLWF